MRQSWPRCYGHDVGFFEQGRGEFAGVFGGQLSQPALDLLGRSCVLDVERYDIPTRAVEDVVFRLHPPSVVRTL
jgi:hypothetical protein